MIYPIMIVMDHAHEYVNSELREMALISLLRDIKRNGALIDSSKGLLMNALKRSVRTFSVASRQHANLLLADLSNKQRIVHQEPLVIAVDESEQCGMLREFGAKHGRMSLILGGTCGQCNSACPPFDMVDTLETYHTGPIVEALGKGQRLFPNGSNPDTFRNQVIQPLISVSKAIKFYDPLMGSKLQTPGNPAPASNFVRGVAGLLKMIDSAREASGLPSVDVSFVTLPPTIGGRPEFNPSVLLSAWQTALDPFITDMHIQFKVIYKLGNKNLFHQRYITNNRFALSIDRGLDIISHNYAMMKCQVDILTDRSPVKEIDGFQSLR